MPELPEVETTVQGLHELINNKIIKIKVYVKKLRYDLPLNLETLLKNCNILKIFRIGKYIIFNLSNDYSVIFHLGMSGRIRLLPKKNFLKENHDHLVFFIKNKVMVFNDARKFGFVDLVTTTKINNKKYIDSLGIDALSENLTIEYLYSKIKTSNVPIKQILLNQKIISGIGNIYASEILFDAKISPFIKGKFVKLNEVKILIMSIKKILLKAIDSGGSTLRDYVSANGTLGNFQNNFKVYNREGLKIEGQRIKRVIQYQRSTFYCPKLQKKTKKK